MKVFISEFVCGGGWDEPILPPSLAQEGRAMLDAIVADCARVPTCRVTTTLHRDQPPLVTRKVETVRVGSPEQEWTRFQQLAGESDACLIIAPELNDRLTQRCIVALKAGTRGLLNPSPEIVSLCSDKLRLFEFCSQRGIPTIETALWTADVASNCPWSPAVIKPRFGAGSQNIQVLRSPASRFAAAILTEEDSDSAASGFIAQPLVEGVAVSVAVLARADGGELDILPVAAQHLSDDGHFHYRGGELPGPGDGAHESQELVRWICAELGPLSGYIGFDLIAPHEHPDRPLLVEINPRLTTSYLGYRQLTTENLAARLLSTDAPSESICWKTTPVTFRPDGVVESPRQRKA